MMIPPPADILRRILDGSLLPPEVISKFDHDAILDARDGDAQFEQEWGRCNDEIKAKWSTAGLAPELLALAKDIERESFMTVSRATHQHEIAAYVAEDCELISRAELLGLHNDFVNWLWDAYERNEIPFPKSDQ